MLYNVEEISETIGLSKQGIYNKLKLKELEEHITKKQGITYIDEVGLNLIKDSLKVDIDDLNQLNGKEMDNTLNDDIVTVLKDSLAFKDGIIEELRYDIGLLIKDGHEKSSIIKEQNIRIISLTDKLTNALEKAHELHQNTQVLYKQSQEQQPQNIKLLEERFQEIAMSKDSYDTKFNKKGLLNKLFKK